MCAYERLFVIKVSWPHANSPPVLHGVCWSNRSCWWGSPGNAVIAAGSSQRTDGWQPVSYGDNGSAAASGPDVTLFECLLVLEIGLPLEVQTESLTWGGMSNFKCCLYGRWKQICQARRYMLHWIQFLQASSPSLTVLLWHPWLQSESAFAGIQL